MNSSPASGRDGPLLPIAIVVTVLAWASAFIVIRAAAAEYHPAALALGRLLVGTAALSLLVIGRRWVRLTAREWLLVGIYGTAWFGLYNAALNTAETTLDAGTTAMVVNIGPLLIALGGALVLREGMTRWLGLGLVIAFAGALLIGASSSTGRVDLAGVVWALVAAVTYAAGVLAQKPVLRRLPNGQVTFLGCAIGAVVLLPFSGQLVADAAAASTGATLGLVYLGIVPTALAFTTWGYALQRMPASRLGVTTYVVPPIVILLGLLVFQEAPAALALAGGALCLAGVAISRRRSRPAPDPDAVPERTGNLAQ
ncbi:DMT family transporter [Homoserinibacter sp. YIM 151385]|uniref:DMT family transporter n=1 Tax=Homoserinibacter sp. YIM 151385 TaxID=2985506 RepID=UPI0022F01C9B|nr:EamA family transporter [Homoserinibacter sp. YIM 151385]WBU39182.1 EamA family transporter [Homoserinibacter sp. YIM 151385]